MRVQIPAYTDRWMMGDRYGEVIGHTRLKRDGRDVTDNELGKSADVYRVRLDKSGKVVKVIADDCTEA